MVICQCSNKSTTQIKNVFIDKYDVSYDKFDKFNVSFPNRWQVGYGNFPWEPNSSLRVTRECKNKLKKHTCFELIFYFHLWLSDRNLTLIFCDHSWEISIPQLVIHWGMIYYICVKWLLTFAFRAYFYFHEWLSGRNLALMGNFHTPFVIC